MADLNEIVSKLTNAITTLAKNQESTVLVIRTLNEEIQTLKKELRRVGTIQAEHQKTDSSDEPVLMENADGI